MNLSKAWIGGVGLVGLVGLVGALGASCGGILGILYECEYPIFHRVTDDGKADPCCYEKPCPGYCLNEPCPCDHPIPGRETPWGELDECCSLAQCPELCTFDHIPPCPGALKDGGADGSTSACEGECLPKAPGGWQGPMLVYFGNAAVTPPTCPDAAPIVAYEGGADLVAPAARCGTCSCAAATGTCKFPEHVAASPLPCYTPTAVSITFDAPADWNGECTTYGAYTTCGTPTAPCAASIRVSELTIQEAACAAAASAPPERSTPSWATVAVACTRSTCEVGTCSNAGETCAPAGKFTEFQHCVEQPGDQVCPPAYSDKHVMYTAWEDHRDCSPCTCSTPKGSTCKGTLLVFADSACEGPVLSTPIASTETPCLDVVPMGAPLGSKALTAMTYQPGHCEPSGGIANGSVELVNPSTFCCQVV